VLSHAFASTSAARIPVRTTGLLAGHPGNDEQQSEYRVGIKLLGLTIVPRVEIVLSRGNVIRPDIAGMLKMQCEGP
jgi:hypothetical protein